METEFSPFFKLLMNFNDTVETIGCIRSDDPDRLKKLAIFKSKLDQLQTRIDEYGKVVRPREKSFGLCKVTGTCQTRTKRTETISYLSSPQAFEIYFVGVSQTDFPLILQYKLRGKINTFQIDSIPLSEPKYI